MSYAPSLSELKSIFGLCGRLFSRPFPAGPKKPPTKPIPACERQRVGGQRKDRARDERPSQERQRRIGEQCEHVILRRRTGTPSHQQRTEIVLCVEDQWRRQRIADPGAKQWPLECSPAPDKRSAQQPTSETAKASWKKRRRLHTLKRSAHAPVATSQWQTADRPVCDAATCLAYALFGANASSKVRPELRRHWRGFIRAKGGRRFSSVSPLAKVR